MKLSFPPGFDYVKQDFEKYGYWEKRTTDYIKSHLKSGQTFLDVGANVGYFTVLASELGAKVISIEPSETNRSFLIKNITDNNCGEVIVIDKALSNENKTVKLYAGKTPGENSLLENYHIENTQNYKVVEAVKYDDLKLEVPDMLKMDIEGFEQQALEGMQSILTTDKPITIIIESWDNKTSDWLVDNYGWKLVTTDRMSGNRILVKNMDVEYEEEPIRCHLLGTFNSPNNLKEGIGNAFGTKVINMAKILKKLGHYVIFYVSSGTCTFRYLKAQSGHT